jgi:P-type Ca2+ transporter type 2C
VNDLSPLGLTSREAAERLVRDGPNVVVPDDRSARWRRLLRPLADPMLVLLLIAAPIYFAIGDTLDAIITLAAVVPIAAVGIVLEGRSERTLERLRRLTAPTAKVRRDGEEIVLAVEDIVVGDLMAVCEGDVVAADGVVREAT